MLIYSDDLIKIYKQKRYFKNNYYILIRKGEITMTFWEIFSKLCVQVGKRPNPVVKEIGVSSAAIANWKAGSIPNGETLMKIADYFNVSVDYLLGRTDESVKVIDSNEADNHNILPVLSTPDSVTEYKPDGVTIEFLRAFEALNFSDKVDTMNFVRDRMRKESIS